MLKGYDLTRALDGVTDFVKEHGVSPLEMRPILFDRATCRYMDTVRPINYKNPSSSVSLPLLLSLVEKIRYGCDRWWSGRSLDCIDVLVTGCKSRPD
jgi:hypothetical protein